jgi:hypothetical protein
MIILDLVVFLIRGEAVAPAADAANRGTIPSGRAQEPNNAGSAWHARCEAPLVFAELTLNGADVTDAVANFGEQFRDGARAECARMLRTAL